MNHVYIAAAGLALGMTLAHCTYSTSPTPRYCWPTHDIPHTTVTARWANPPATTPAEADAPTRIPEPWELWASDHGCSDKVLALISDTCGPYSTDGVNMPALIAAVALPESSYSVNCSYKGHLGLMQVSTQHKAAFKRAGLDIYSETDRLTWSCQAIRAKLEAGKGLYAALQPWSTRSKALRNYFQMTSAGEVE